MNLKNALHNTFNMLMTGIGLDVRPMRLMPQDASLSVARRYDQILQNLEPVKEREDVQHLIDALEHVITDATDQEKIRIFFDSARILNQIEESLGPQEDFESIRSVRAARMSYVMLYTSKWAKETSSPTMAR